jgi:large subunit ribosomal protein L21
MYAIIQDGGKQYRVEKGYTLYLETRKLPDGAKTLALDCVLMIGDGAKSKVGAPYLEGASVTARVEGPIKGPKLEIFKFRRRKGYKLHKGHRQKHLKVTIDKIDG